MDMERGILLTSRGLGVCRGKSSSLFGVRQAVRSLSEGEGAGVLLEAGVSEGAQAEMAQ